MGMLSTGCMVVLGLCALYGMCCLEQWLNN